MVRITIYQKETGDLTGFDAAGHAGYAESGEDIVCAAVSALVINCVNSVELLTDAAFTSSEDEESGTVVFRLKEQNEYAQLFLKSFLLGISQIEETCEDFVEVIVKEVSGHDEYESSVLCS